VGKIPVINGNYDYTGLSAWDQLAVHIMYPEDDLAAEYIGTTVIPVNSTLRLQSAWKARGANTSFAAQNFVWQLNGTALSTTTDLAVTPFIPGAYTLQLTYSDFLGRNYKGTGVVRVLDDDTYTKEVVAPRAAISPLLTY
jgi:hypothetical protein